MTSEETSARTVMEWCDILGSYSEEPDRLTRPFASLRPPSPRKRGEGPLERLCREGVGSHLEN